MKGEKNKKLIHALCDLMFNNYIRASGICAMMIDAAGVEKENDSLLNVKLLYV